MDTATESEPPPPATDGDTSNSDNTELNARITTLEEELASARAHSEALKEVETLKAKVDNLQTELDGREDMEEELMHDKEDVRSKLNFLLLLLLLLLFDFVER